MNEKENTLKIRLSKEMYERLSQIHNSKLYEFLADVIELCNPKSVFISTGNHEDLEYIKKRAIEAGEEIPLKTQGHTAHFDSPADQARARDDTFILSDPMPFINTKDREIGIKEIVELLRDSMKDREMLVGFYSLGPKLSPFEILAVQVTDSYYVMHNENIMYRQAYDEFVRLGESANFLKFVHSIAQYNMKKRRIYIDLRDETVYSINTTYGGNSMGLKKLALRLTIKRAMEEGWLSEHMFVIGVNGPNGRVTYFTGAYPSMSGKTSTAMLERLVGDDLAYIREINDEVRAVNPEIGVFGIIEGINSVDDPVIFKVLSSPGEIIFSNVLIKSDGTVYWNGKDEPIPERGVNYTGEWWIGKKDEKGNEIPPSHPNARFTAPLTLFPNLDKEYEDPLGVPVKGFIFGGRDSDTAVPVLESFNWAHGVVTIASSLESERTAAVIGKVGVREFNPMANLDFLSVPLNIYIEKYLEFGKKVKKPPRIFGVNYFLKDEKGHYLNSKEDKRVWLKWMERRVYDELKPIRTPVGYIPAYEDLAELFKVILDVEYKKEDYEKQFSIRIDKYLEKISRIRGIYEKVTGMPKEFFDVLNDQEKRLLRDKEKYGSISSPFNYY